MQRVATIMRQPQPTPPVTADVALNRVTIDACARELNAQGIVQHCLDADPIFSDLIRLTTATN